MPGESGYGIQQDEDGGNRRRALCGRPAAIKQDGSDEDAASYSRKSRNETDARPRDKAATGTGECVAVSAKSFRKKSGGAAINRSVPKSRLKNKGGKVK
jgi:hypothetical protein